MSRIRAFWKEIALVLSGVMVGLALCELLLAFFDLPKFYNAHRSPSDQFFFKVFTDRTYFYTYQPSSDIEFIYDGNPRNYFDANNAVRHHTNSWGFRGREFRSAKDSLTVRLAFLGDSFTFGEGVKDSDTYSEQTASLCNDKKALARKVESYNFGVGGYNTEQELLLLEKTVLPLNPDAVIVGYNLNDAESKLFYADYFHKKVLRRPLEPFVSETGPDVRPPRAGIFALRTFQLIWKWLRKQETTERTIAYYDSLYSNANPNWDKTKESLDEIIHQCERNKLHCVVLCFPVLFELDGDYPLTHIHALIRNEVTSHHSEYVHFVDLLPFLAGRRDRDLWVHPADHHPNETVHRIVAQVLCDSLQTIMKR